MSLRSEGESCFHPEDRLSKAHPYIPDYFASDCAIPPSTGYGQLPAPIPYNGCKSCVLIPNQVLNAHATRLVCDPPAPYVTPATAACSSTALPEVPNYQSDSGYDIPSAAGHLYSPAVDLPPYNASGGEDTREEAFLVPTKNNSRQRTVQTPAPFPDPLGLLSPQLKPFPVSVSFDVV